MTEVTIVQSRVELADPHNCTDSNDVLTVFEALFRPSCDLPLVAGLNLVWRNAGR